MGSENLAISSFNKKKSPRYNYSIIFHYDECKCTRICNRTFAIVPCKNFPEVLCKYCCFRECENVMLSVSTTE